jgi:peptidoglycan/xylan/chitin deacetylase (PgdA/CDA1 family)
MRNAMQLWKQVLLGSYVWATAPIRKKRLAELARQGRAPVCILFYHRVADHTKNDWTISNRRFEHQMRWLAKRADFLSLKQAQDRLRDGNDRLAVCVTFDDGYADNCERAIPFLMRQNIPVTYFVALDFVQTGRPFPHDAARHKPLRPNTIAQLRQMASAGIEIGGHTRHHTDLGPIRDESVLQDEVVTSAVEISSEVGCPVRYFAFPFGKPMNLNERAIELASAAGMRGVLSAHGGYNFPPGDRFHLCRIHGDPEFVRLKNWMTLDPRKSPARDHAEQFIGQPLPTTEGVS